MARSTCQAGYKGMWTASDGFPSKPFLRSVHPAHGRCCPVENARLHEGARSNRRSLVGLDGQAVRIPRRHPGEHRDHRRARRRAGRGRGRSGNLGDGVRQPVRATCSTRSSTTPCRVSQGSSRMASCLECSATRPAKQRWATRSTGCAVSRVRRIFNALADAAAPMEPGADGVLCVDWFNGCRTPLMDGNLSGAFTGLSLRHGPHHMYRAMLEANAFGLRWIVDLLRERGVPVKKFIATGGLPHSSPLFVQVAADVLGENILIHPSQQGPALGAAILGAVAAGKRAGGFSSVRSPCVRSAAFARMSRGGVGRWSTPTGAGRSCTRPCIAATGTPRRSCSATVPALDRIRAPAWPRAVLA